MNTQIEPNLDDCIDRLKKWAEVITDKSLANILGMTPANLSNYRSGDGRGFPYKWLISTARVHNISIDWLLFGDPPHQEKKMITKNDLLTASYTGKKAHELGYAYQGVLTADEAFFRSRNTKDVIVISNNEYFFFSDDHCFGVNILDENEWSPCTSVFPQMVVARPSLEDGHVDTIEKFIQIFCRDMKQIESLDDLVNLLNTVAQPNCP